MDQKREQTVSRSDDSFQRFSLHLRLQHIFLFVSVIVLILTGIPLWLSLGGAEDIRMSQETVRAAGGIDVYRVIHRISGVVLILVSAWHLLYIVLTREGRRQFVELLPRGKDFTDLAQNSLYFMGLRRERPRFDRYTYFEKFDYWAVYWGCVFMIGSGIVLWYPDFTAQYVPWLTYTLASEIHAGEAILAALVLFVWHFYNVHFKPSRFPGSLSWWHGRISHEEMMSEHPLEYERLRVGTEPKDEA